MYTNICLYMFIYSYVRRTSYDCTMYVADTM